MEGYMKLCQDGVQIDKALKASIFQLFIEVLTPCKIYAKVEKDSNTTAGKIKNVMKAAIRYDPGLQSTLDEIRAATEHELNNNVAALRITDINSNANNQRNMNLKKLKEYLKVGGKELHWMGMQESLRSEHINGMGEWLFELEDVTSWLDAKHQSEASILVLETPASHGKSHLCFQNIQHLNDQQAEQIQKNITSVAWYFSQRTQEMPKASIAKGKKQVEGKRIRFSFREALSALIYQFAENDAKFRAFAMKEVATYPHGFTKAADLWKKIIMEYSNSFKSETDQPQKIFYLIFDGCEISEESKYSNQNKGIVEEITRDLEKSQKRGLQIRLLLSGSRRFDESTGNSKVKSKISLRHRDWDAEVFIRSHLEQPEALQNRETNEQRILLEIRMNLLTNFEGNYHELNATLQDIKRSGERGLLQEFQGEEKDYSSIIFRRKLEILSEDLESDDIDVLNDLMACVAYWEVWPSVQNLKDYLLLRLGKNSKQSIETQITEKFVRLVSIDENTNRVLWSHQGFVNSIEDAMTFPSIHKEARISCCLQGVENEMKQKSVQGPPLCKHELLESGVSPKAYKRWTEQHMATRPRVHVDPKNDRVDTIFTLLRTVCDEQFRSRPEAKSITEYTAAWLPL